MMNVAELRARMGELPPLALTNMWDRRRQELRLAVWKDDPLKFLSWALIQSCMFVGDAPYVTIELKELQDSVDFDRYIIAMEDFGEFGGGGYPRGNFTATGNSVRQAYHIMQWEKATGKRIENLSAIVEFGGGYGSMARTVYNLGFRGRYTIYDLPEFSLLQQYYLSNVGVPSICTSDASKIRSCDLMVGLWSLGEVNPQERGDFMGDIVSDSYLLSYCARWDGWDNMGWFGEFAASRPDMQWTTYPIEHLVPNYYTIGDIG